MTERSARTLYVVRQLQLQARSSIEGVLRPFDLTASQYMALSMLGHRDGLSSAQLARRFGVTPQTIILIVSALEERRLISRRETPGNRRILRASLTQAGLQLLATCEALVDRVEADLFHGLTGAEMATFRRSLLKVVDSNAKKQTAAATSLPHAERRDDSRTRARSSR